MKKIRISVIVILSFFVPMFGTFLWCFDPLLYSARGIDISHHQQNIDWDAVATGNVNCLYESTRK